MNLKLLVLVIFAWAMLCGAASWHLGDAQPRELIPKSRVYFLISTSLMPVVVVLLGLISKVETLEREINERSGSGKPTAT